MTDLIKEPIHFFCLASELGCGHRWQSREYETEPLPSRDWYPFKHISECPDCGLPAGRQASWELGQWKLIHDGQKPGPATPEGLAKISEAQRERDPASYQNSRFNRLKNFSTAQVADFYPAVPGRYANCEGCEWRFNGCGTEFDHCLKRFESFHVVNMAMQSGNASLLSTLQAKNQAGVIAILQDMIRGVATKGVMIETPEFFVDKESGRVKLAEYTDQFGQTQRITKLEANPLLAPLIQFISKNGMSLTDLNMTPKTSADEAILKGNLDDSAANRETFEESVAMQREQMSKLMGLIGSGPKDDVVDAEFSEVDDE